MPQLSPPLTPATLAPSEVVMLRAADFAAPGRLGFGEHVLGGDGKVNALEWMRAAWLAATAAVVASGDVRLTPTSTKHLFGLVNSHGVSAERAGGAGDWPAGSLESRLVGWIARGPTSLSDAYVAVLAETTANPEILGLAIARAGLLGRGLLESRATRLLKFLPSTEIVVPPATAAAADGVAVAPVQALVRTGGAVDPITWALVGAALKRAIEARTSPQDRASES